MKKTNSVGNNITFKTELINVEDNNDKLKLTFKTTANEPLLFNFNNEVIALTENYDIYKILFDTFPTITLNHMMKNAGTDYNEIFADEYVIDVGALGFNDFNEFKQFVLRYPAYIRYLEFIYHIFNDHPDLHLLYTARMDYKHDIKISDDGIEITMEKIHIDVIIKEYEIDEKMTFKILNKNDRMLLIIGKIPLIDFGSLFTYNDIVKILKERPNAILNTIIMLISTYLEDIGHV
jgi:hypothetical protein